MLAWPVVAVSIRPISVAETFGGRRSLAHLFRLGALALVLVMVGPATRAYAQPCSPGSFSGSGNEPCFPCSLGSYQDQSGQTSCTQCGLGTFSDTEGAAVCSPCG